MVVSKLLALQAFSPSCSHMCLFLEGVASLGHHQLIFEFHNAPLLNQHGYTRTAAPFKASVEWLQNDSLSVLVSPYQFMWVAHKTCIAAVLIPSCASNTCAHGENGVLPCLHLLQHSHASTLTLQHTPTAQHCITLSSCLVCNMAKGALLGSPAWYIHVCWSRCTLHGVQC